MLETSQMSDSEDLDSNDDMNDLGYLQNQAAIMNNAK
jgi:hypothetical protein